MEDMGDVGSVLSMKKYDVEVHRLDTDDRDDKRKSVVKNLELG